MGLVDLYVDDLSLHSVVYQILSRLGGFSPDFLGEYFTIKDGLGHGAAGHGGYACTGWQMVAAVGPLNHSCDSPSLSSSLLH